MRRNVILVVLSQRFQESHVAQQTFARSPIVVLLFTGNWILDPKRRYAQHHAHRSHNESHSGRRTSHCSHNRYICRLQCVQSS